MTTTNFTKRPILIGLLVGLCAVIGIASPAVSVSTQTPVETVVKPTQPKPKYGPQATRLSRDHDYFKKADAPDFWALIPYYIPQQTESACSVASVTMVMNALRVPSDLKASEPLITQDSLPAKAGRADWKRAVSQTGSGIKSLEQLAEMIRASLKAYGLENYQVTVVRTENTSSVTLTTLRKDLTANERSSSDFIVANFIQGKYTGDADVGHIAPIAAYDAKTKRALVLDPDREWYEPYWVSDATLLSGMATLDSGAGKNRGYILIRK